MSWLARSIANSLKFEDDDQQPDKNTATSAGTTDNVNNNKDFSNPKSDQQQSATPRGVKEDLTDLKQTLTRQLWGVASFLAPPPEPPLTENRSHSSDLDGSNDADVDAEDDAALIAGIRSDFAEIGGRFKSGISKLSSNKTVSEFTKIASNLLQLGSESDEIETTVSAAASAVGVTEEVVGFARDVAMHPETWLDFPLPDVQAFEDFDMSDAQQEHALAVEHLAPRLAALRIELCPGYMSEGCFWKIYFVLLHPRLSKHDAELLSTPQIVEARAMLSHELQNKTKAKSTPDWSGVGTFNVKDTADLPHEESLTVPSRATSESVPITTSGMEAVSSTLAAETFDDEAAPSIVSFESETKKHPVESTQMQIIDKSVVEEGKVDQTKHQHSPSSSSSGVLEEKFDDDGDDWLKDDSSEMIGVSGPSMPLGNDEDVSFSDLEEDDGDEPASVKKGASGSDCAGKGSQDWVQLSRSSSDSVKDIKPVSIKNAGSEKVSARNSEKKINLKKEKGMNKKTEPSKNKENQNKSETSTPASASQQLSFFINEFQSANAVQLSSIELESINETCFVELSQEFGHDVMALGNHMKTAFGPSWKQVLCEGKLMEGNVDPGSPAVLIISTSALRSLELLRGVRSLTKECHAAKLFSKHMKVEEQVDMLKNRVNFASGTPSRVKKLIDIEALGLSRLKMIVLDMQADVKGYSLFTLPQVRDEFWDLYKDFFHQRLLEGHLRICLFGPTPNAGSKEFTAKKKSSS